MEKLPVEISGFYYAMGYLEGIIEADKFNESLKMRESERYECILLSLDRLYERMVNIKMSAGEQNRLTKGDQDG